MYKEKLVSCVSELELSPGEYALFGGACLAVREIRDFGDIDMFVSAPLFDRLKIKGWSEAKKGERPPYLVNKVHGLEYQAFHVWVGGEWIPDVKGYISEPEMIDGIAFMPLRALYEWKKATQRPKDLVDISLIENYWAKSAK